MGQRTWEELGISLPELVLPKDRELLAKWCVIACDQYTSDRVYWENVTKSVGNAPSTLHMVLPEVYLGDADVDDRIRRINTSMAGMLQSGAMETMPRGLMLVERTFTNHSRTRTGLLMALDLERYDYAPNATTLIRATEGTIPSRIPPRLKIRENASLEFPHIMVLIDDPKCDVIEPLVEQKDQFYKAYESDLGFSMGHITGYFIDAGRAEPVREAFSGLLDSLGRPESGDPMLFAMGDGNHSFATAKAFWERIRPTLSEEERKNHPARYALCEVINIHNPGIEFEAIHRVAFGVSWDALVWACDMAETAGITASFEPMGGAVRVDAVHDGRTTALYLLDKTGGIAPGLVDGLLSLVKEKETAMEVDYIHGEEEVFLLCQKDNIGFLLPSLKKSELFGQVSRFGPLPRKAFSMGEANEKRCYLEGRAIRR